MPGDPDGPAWGAPPRGTGRLDLAKAVTPGTEEHQAVMADLKVTADYLQQLAEARVPVLWRPLHEIDGGWTFTWQNAPKGLHNIVAVAEDSDGAVACSNVVRVSVGVENLTRGGKATASSTSERRSYRRNLRATYPQVRVLRRQGASGTTLFQTRSILCIAIRRIE
jgi:hypothetical protein